MSSRRANLGAAVGIKNGAQRDKSIAPWPVIRIHSAPLRLEKSGAPKLVAAMAEKGIDVTAEHPKRWTKAMVEAADVVVTMACGDTCPFVPGRRYEDWELPDPAGQPLDAVRPVRDEIESRVRQLLSEFGLEPTGSTTARPLCVVAAVRYYSACLTVAPSEIGCTCGN